MREKLPVLVLFLPPALLLFTVFVIFPMGEAAWYSFYSWNGYSLPTEWVGFKNFELIFRNGAFRTALIVQAFPQTLNFRSRRTILSLAAAPAPRRERCVRVSALEKVCRLWLLAAPRSGLR